jgi:hypothetical protein
MPDEVTAGGTSAGNGGSGTQDSASWSPPYIAFANFLHLLDRLEDNLPPRIDRSFLTGSNAVNTMTLAALRSLGLIDADGRPQQALVDLAQRPEERKPLIAALITRWFPKPVQLGGINATQSQLEEAFAEWGITGDTRRKAIAFYLKAAKFADLPVSANFRTPSITRSEGTTRGPRRVKRKNGVAPPPPAEASVTPATDTNPAPKTDTGLSALLPNYVQMLMQKAAESDELNPELLDRIEKILLGTGKQEG